MRKALIFYGGWDGHEPEQCAALFAEQLQQNGFDVTSENHMKTLEEAERLAEFDLIIPVWTMGELTAEATANLSQVVKNGTGLAGFHGGAGDAFRGNLDFEWMIGGHFTGHPYVGPYQIEVKDLKHPVTEGLAALFEYDSEQYYMMIDPAVTVLATTPYDYNDEQVEMPVIWVRKWGQGRVFYSALGHIAEEFRRYPKMLDMTLRGMMWAAR